MIRQCVATARSCVLPAPNDPFTAIGGELVNIVTTYTYLHFASDNLGLGLEAKAKAKGLHHSTNHTPGYIYRSAYLGLQERIVCSALS